MVADDGAGKGEEGCGDEFGTGAGEEGAGEDEVTEVWGEGFHGEVGKGFGRGSRVGEGENAEMGGLSAGGIGHGWTSGESY